MLDTQHLTPDTLHPTPSHPFPSPRPKLLIVEDDADLRTQLKWALAQDYEILVAGDRSSALEIVRRERPAVITLDLGLPPYPQDVKEGFHTLDEMLGQDHGSKVIVISGRNEREHAVGVIGEGAYDFLCKPIQIEELKVILKRAFHVYQLEKEHRELQGRSSDEPFEGMLGSSAQMKAVFEVIRKVAPADVPVLITGESGTGKELVARAIHQQSARKEGPFVAINCGAIPENLMESELFGYEKGAFTGAHVQRKGRIEMACGGTLLLDEVAELSLPLQVKLLRYLQEQRIERIGGRGLISVDARVLAATNIDLKEAMNQGRFREDLYYRLKVVSIMVPPLRERKEDVMLQARVFQQRCAAKEKRKITGFSSEGIAAMETYNWPGNTRELENRIRRAMIMATGPKLTAADLELTSPYPLSKGRRLSEARESVEKDIIKRTLARCKGKISKAAADLGISRPTLYDRMYKLGIENKRA